MVEMDLSGDCINMNRIVTLKCSCGEPYRLILGCHKRFKIECPTCSYKWMKSIRNRYSQGFANMKDPKLLTLTLRKSSKEDKDIENIGTKKLWNMRNEYFKILKRGSKKLNIPGYKIRSWFAIVELPNHIHIVFDGPYIPKHILKMAWVKVTRSSFIVDIEKIDISRNKKKVVKYITKYMTKSCCEEGYDIDKLKHFKFCGSWNIVFERPSLICEVCGNKHSFHIIDEFEYVKSIPYAYNGILVD